MAQRANAPAEQFTALGTFAWVADGEGDTQAALDYSQRARLLAESIGDVRHTAIYAGLMAHFYTKLGQLQPARELLETAVHDLQALGIRANEPALPRNLYRLAVVLYRQGDYIVAAEHCRRGLTLLQEQGQTMFHRKELVQQTTIILAHCCYAQGQREAAIQYLLELLATVDDPVQQAKIQETLAQFA